MSGSQIPFDDTVQLETMDTSEYNDDDTSPIFRHEREIPPPETGQEHVIVAGGETNHGPPTGRKQAYVTIATLLLINLLNYMDRFTIAGKPKVDSNLQHSKWMNLSL